ncbi:MAG TPA: hypothetical protein VM841_03425, partial [Actinomycetota bacterium]|nr:hypothetical protein [Actinomycetota bacterium]
MTGRRRSRWIVRILALVSLASTLPANAAGPTVRSAPYDFGCFGDSGSPSSCVPWPGARETGLVQAGSAFGVYPS